MPPRRSSRFLDSEASAPKRKPRKRASSSSSDEEADEVDSDGKSKSKKEEEPPKVTADRYSLDADVVQSVCEQYMARGLPVYLGVDIGELNCGLCMFVPYLGPQFTRSASQLRDIKVRVLVAIRFGFDRRAKHIGNAVANVVDEFFRQFTYPRLVTNVVLEGQLKKNPRMNAICSALHRRLESECHRASIIEQPAWHKFSMSVWLPSTTPIEYRVRKEASSTGFLNMLAADTTTPHNKALAEFIRSLPISYDVCDAFWTGYADMVSNRSTLQRLITDEERFMAAEAYLGTRERCNREHSRSKQRQILASHAIHDVAAAAAVAIVNANSVPSASSLAASGASAPRRTVPSIGDSGCDLGSSDSESDERPRRRVTYDSDNSDSDDSNSDSGSDYEADKAARHFDKKSRHGSSATSHFATIEI